MSSLSIQDCATRAAQALAAEGYTVNEPSWGERWGTKSIHKAYISCDYWQDGKIQITIFVASNAVDGAVPGSERVHLQQRMAGGAPGCGLGVRWVEKENGWTGNWVRRGVSNVFDGSWQYGDRTGSSVLTMTQNGNQVHIERQDPASFGGQLTIYDGTLGSDGTFNGTGRLVSTGLTYPITATVICGH